MNDIPKHYPYADLLFDYADFLRQVEINDGIAKYTGENCSVAIIGSGAAGITAGYELMRAGITDIQIYSPDDEKIRPYGRMNPIPFKHQDKQGRRLVAEMGAMRFPISAVGLFHYLNKMGITTKSDFPDPGLVKTLLSVNGESYVWEQNQKPPKMFERVSNGWHEFLEQGCFVEGEKLPAPHEISTDLQNMELEQASKKWQKLLDVFGKHTFHTALVNIFQKSDKPPCGEKWTDDDIELFGTLGIGSGGFKPVYNLTFIEVLRLMVNGFEIKQQFIPDGSDAVFDALAKDSFNGKSLKEKIIYLNEENALIDIQVNNGKYDVKIGSSEKRTFDYVINTAPVWSLQANFKGGINAMKKLQLIPNVPSIGDKQRNAIMTQHVIASTKVFVLTKDKFWLKDPELYSNIQSDSLTHGFYCLDYNPDNPDGYGVVLLSYTWENDAHKLAGYSSLTDEQKAHRLLDCLEQIDAAKPTADRIRNDMLEIQTIEWMNTPNYHGAFRLPIIGSDIGGTELYWDFVKCKDEKTDTKFYLAGDSCTFNAGWVESAIQSGLNAVTGILHTENRNGNVKDMLEYNPVNNSCEGKYDYSIK